MAGTEHEDHSHFKSFLFFVYLSGKGNTNFIKGSGEGEERVGVCVCAVIHIGKSRPFSYFTRS